MAMQRVVNYANDNYTREIVTETIEEVKTELVPQLIPENPEEPTVTYVNGKCTCCPYGYHIDVDFVRYCNAMANGTYLRRLKKIKKTKRKLRKSMEIFLQQQERTHQEMNSYPPPDVVHSSEAFITQIAHDDSAANVILDEIDSSVEATIASIDGMMRPRKLREDSLESDESLSPVMPRYGTFPRFKGGSGYREENSLTTISRTDSTSSLSSESTLSSEKSSPAYMETMTTNFTNVMKTTVTSAQLAETMATHLPELTQSGIGASAQCPGLHITHTSLQAIREAMAISLQRMRELEEQVKAIPVLQVRISVLKEEKRLLNLQLKAKNSRLNMRSIGVGHYTIDEPMESRVTETSQFLTRLQSPQPYGYTSRTVSSFSSGQQQQQVLRSSVRSIGTGDHSVEQFYLIQPNIASEYEWNVINQVSTHTHEKDTVFLSQMARDGSLKSSRVAFTQHLLNNQKPLTRSIGVGESNVFESTGGYHIHEKELRTVIIGQSPSSVGKRNVGVECRVPTRDVGISYNCEVEKPTTRSIGVGVVDSKQSAINIKFEGEDWKTMVREVLKKSVRTVGVNCRMTVQTRDVGVMHAYSDTRTVGCSTDSLDVVVRPVVSTHSVGVHVQPECRNQGMCTEKGWRLDSSTNTPRKIYVPRAMNTEATRGVSVALMTDSPMVIAKGAQTDMKIFLATDILKHTGINTTHVRMQNTGVNTETKLLKSDNFDMDITFKENSTNTSAFRVEDKSINTTQFQQRDDQWDTDEVTVTRNSWENRDFARTRPETEKATTVRTIETRSANIPTQMERTVKRTQRLSPAEVESMMADLERTVQSQESTSSSSYSSGGGRDRDNRWRREVVSNVPESGYRQTTMSMMLGSGGGGSSGSGSLESRSTVLRGSEGTDGDSQTSSSWTQETRTSLIGGSDRRLGSGRTEIQRSFKQVRTMEEEEELRLKALADMQKQSNTIVQEEEQQREGQFIRLGEGALEGEKDDEVWTTSTEEYMVRKHGDNMDFMQIGGIPEHVVGGENKISFQRSVMEDGRTEESHLSEGGDQVIQKVTIVGKPSSSILQSELDRLRMSNQAALVANKAAMSHVSASQYSGDGGGGGFTRTTEIRIDGGKDPKKQRTVKKTIMSSSSSSSGAGGMSGGMSGSARSGGMMESSSSGSFGLDGMSRSSSEMTQLTGSSGVSNSSGMSESYGTSFSSGSSQLSGSSSAGGSFESSSMSYSGGGQTRMSADDNFPLRELEENGGTYRMTKESRTISGDPNVQRSVKKTMISSSSSGGVQSDGGGFLNRHAVSYGNVNDGQLESNLKSCMKRSSSEPQVKKGIKFAETVIGGYESSSSEEGEHSESESDSSFEEGSYDGREGNIVYSCKDDEAIARGIPGAKMFDQNIRETYELSGEMVAACEVLANYLEDSTNVQTKQLNSSLNTIQQDWFKASSRKLSSVHMVEDYLSSFNEISKRILEYIVNIADSNGNTSLHYAVSHCNFEVVSLLLDTGICNVDKQNKAGYSPIMLGALSSVQTDADVQVLRQLFDAGDVNGRASQAGQTALMLAVSHGRLDMVKMLLEADADVNVQDDDGSTALMCACEHGHTEIVKALLAHHSCDANITDNDGSTALSIAMEAGHKDVGVLLYAHLNFSKQISSPGLSRKRKGSGGSPTSSVSKR